MSGCSDPNNQCGIYAGVGIAFRVAEAAGVDAADIKEELYDQKITVQDALDKIKDRLTDDWDRGLVEEVEDLMKKEQEKQQKQCVSVKVKVDVGKQIQEWIDTRDLPPVVVENLKKSKEAIDSLPTCEA